MRILAVCTDYPPNQGGIATLSWSTLLHLQEQGHTVRVLATGSDRSVCDLFDQAQPFATTRIYGRLCWQGVNMLTALRRELRDFKPDAVWSAVWFPAAVLVSYLSPAERPVQALSVYAAEFLPFDDGWKQKVKARLGFLRERVLQRSHVIFALSRYTRDALASMGADLAKVQVLPGGVADAWFEIERHPSAEPTLLTVARLDEHKGHDMVIRALPELLTRHPRLRYVMVGPGEENWPRLERIGRELGVLHALDYRGCVSPDEVRRAYSEATVFVMASREIPGRLVEGFGLSFLEASAAGLPSVAGNSGGVPDAVDHGLSGLLVDPSSPAEIAAAIGRLLDDPAYAELLGKQGRERAQRNFTWSVIARQMGQALEAVNLEVR